MLSIILASSAMVIILLNFLYLIGTVNKLQRELHDTIRENWSLDIEVMNLKYKGTDYEYSWTGVPDDTSPDDLEFLRNKLKGDQSE